MKPSHIHGQIVTREQREDKAATVLAAAAASDTVDSAGGMATWREATRIDGNLAHGRGIVS